MAAKRNSHAYMCENASQKDPQPQQQLPTYTSHRSRRSSKSSITKEDVVKAAAAADDDVARIAVSVREAANLARGQNTLTVAMDTAVTNALRTKDTMSSKISVSSMSSTSTASSEVSIASKSDRPHNFGIVVPGVYRSSYPKSDDYEYIKGLKLKTLVTLVKKDELDHDLETFVTSNGIRQVIINMQGTKKEAIPPKTMKAILSVILDRQNHPLLIHCNHGKHRTGCVVGVVRKLSGWGTESVVDEYRSYAQPKIRECDVAYLEAFQISSLKESSDSRLAGDWASSRSAPQKRTFIRALILSVMVLIVWMISGSQLTAAATARPDRLL